MAKKKKKILVIDDELYIRKIASYLLKESKFDVVTADSGEDGIKKAKSEKPDIITMDLNMPRLDGVKTSRLLKDDPETKHIPIIAVTAYLTSDIIPELKKSGVEYFVEKPFEINELINKIEYYINK